MDTASVVLFVIAALFMPLGLGLGVVGIVSCVRGSDVRSKWCLNGWGWYLVAVGMICMIVGTTWYADRPLVGLNVASAFVMAIGLGLGGMGIKLCVRDEYWDSAGCLKCCFNGWGWYLVAAGTISLIVGVSFSVSRPG